MEYFVSVDQVRVVEHLESLIGRSAARQMLGWLIRELATEGDGYRECNVRISDVHFLVELPHGLTAERAFRFVVCDEWAAGGVLEVVFVDEVEVAQ